MGTLQIIIVSSIKHWPWHCNHCFNQALDLALQSLLQSSVGTGIPSWHSSWQFHSLSKLFSFILCLDSWAGLHFIACWPDGNEITFQALSRYHHGHAEAFSLQSCFNRVQAPAHQACCRTCSVQSRAPSAQSVHTAPCIIGSLPMKTKVGDSALSS